MMLIKAILVITGLALAAGNSFAPMSSGKSTSQMKDNFAGVNPKHRVKRQTQIGTCTYKCNKQQGEASHKCHTFWGPADGKILPKIVGKCDDVGCFGDDRHCTSSCIGWLGEKPDGTCGQFQEYVNEKIYE